jgi:hypothetical protein
VPIHLQNKIENDKKDKRNKRQKIHRQSKKIESMNATIVKNGKIHG